MQGLLGFSGITVVEGVVWVGSCVGPRCSSDVVILVVWAFLLGLFVAFGSFIFAVYFLFPRVMVPRLVALSPMMVLGGHGCCGLRVCGFRVCRCGSMPLCWVCCGCGAVRLTGRVGFVKVFPRVEGCELGVAYASCVTLSSLAGIDDWVPVCSRDGECISEVVWLCGKGDAEFCAMCFRRLPSHRAPVVFCSPSFLVLGITFLPLPVLVFLVFLEFDSSSRFWSMRALLLERVELSGRASSSVSSQSAM